MKKELEDSQAKKLQELFEEVTNHEVPEEDEFFEADEVREDKAKEKEALPEAKKEQEEFEAEAATVQALELDEMIENEQIEKEEIEKTAEGVAVEEITPVAREIKFAYEEIDVLNLPPRSEVHSQSKTRLSVSLKKPTARFILVLLFLIVIMAVIYFFYEDEIMTFINDLLG